MPRRFGSIRVPVPGEQSASEFFSGMPSQVEKFLGKGFEAFASLDEGAQARAVPLALERIQSGVERYGFTANPIAEELDISESDAAAIFATITITALVLATGDANTPQAFLDAALEKGLLTEGNTQAIRELAQRIYDERDDVRARLERLWLVQSILPILSKFETSLDFRVKIEDNATLVVPVVVVEMSIKDGDEETLRFQLTAPQIDALIQDLTEIQERLRASEDVVESLEGLTPPSR